MTVNTRLMQLGSPAANSQSNLEPLVQPFTDVLRFSTRHGFVLDMSFNLVILPVMKTLTDLIDEGWQHLAEAAKNEDWLATRQAFTYMEKLQEINEESTKTLQKQFPEIATASPTGNGPAEDDFKWLSQIVGTRRPTTRPKELRIESDRIPISMNNQIVVATANWILKQGKPIPRMKNFTNPTNSGFAKSAKTKQLDDGSYIEIGDSQDTLIQKAKRLLTVCGFAELKLEVLLEDGAVRAP